MPASCDQRYIRSPDARLKAVGESTAVYLPAQRSIHVLNQTAHLLFELLSEPTTKAELCEALNVATDGDPRDIDDDVTVALEEFVAKGIIEVEE